MLNTAEILQHMKHVLIPIDKSDVSQKVVKFATCLLSPFCNNLVEEVILLHVLGTSYIEKMAANIDTRILALKESPFFKRIAQEYIDREIMPFLNEIEKQMLEWGLKCSIKKEIIEGDPPKEIVNFAMKRQIQTVFIGRRRRSVWAEKVLGSCSAAICHRPGRHTDYIVGQRDFDSKCPIPKILVPIDGSKVAESALKEALALASAFSKNVLQVGLIHVVELAYIENLEKKEEADHILNQGKSIASELGFDTDLLKIYLKYGDPADEIVKLAEEEDYNLIMMGRTGKGSLREIILGSVSTKVVHSAVNPTVALVSS